MLANNHTDDDHDECNQVNYTPVICNKYEHYVCLLNSMKNFKNVMAALLY